MVFPDWWDIAQKFGPSLTAVTITGMLSTWQARRKRRDELVDAAAREAAEKLASTEAEALAARQQAVSDRIKQAHDRAEEAIRMLGQLRSDVFAGLQQTATDLRNEFTGQHHRVRSDSANAIGAIGNRVLAVEKSVAALEAVQQERTP